MRQSFVALNDGLNSMREGVVHAKLTEFPSGAFYLDVHIATRLFVMTYLPSENGFGVDEVLEGEGFDMGYRHWYTNFEDAKTKLMTMVRTELDT